MLKRPSDADGLSFSRAEIGALRRNYEFRRAYEKGKSFVSPFVVTYVFARRSQGIRVGVTTGKKIGGAVQRNRARRVVKAALFGLLDGAKGGFDIVFVCRTRILELKSTDLRPVLYAQLVAAGVVQP